MKTTTVVATAAEDYIHIILLSWQYVLNTRLGAVLYIMCTASGCIRRILSVTSGDRLCTGPSRFSTLIRTGPLGSFVTRRRRRIVKTVRNNATSYRRENGLLPGFPTVYIILKYFYVRRSLAQSGQTDSISNGFYRRD